MARQGRTLGRARNLFHLRLLIRSTDRKRVNRMCNRISSRRARRRFRRRFRSAEPPSHLRRIQHLAVRLPFLLALHRHAQIPQVPRSLRVSLSPPTRTPPQVQVSRPKRGLPHGPPQKFLPSPRLLVLFLRHLQSIVQVKHRAPPRRQRRAPGAGGRLFRLGVPPCLLVQAPLLRLTEHLEERQQKQPARTWATPLETSSPRSP